MQYALGVVGSCRIVVAAPFGNNEEAGEEDGSKLSTTQAGCSQ